MLTVKSAGSSLTYIPLSIHFPSHFKELLARQEVCAQEEAWLLCDTEPTMADQCKPFLHHLESSPATSSSIPLTTKMNSPVELQDELSAAIETPLTSPMICLDKLQVKTSDTHPIKYVPSFQQSRISSPCSTACLLSSRQSYCLLSLFTFLYPTNVLPLCLTSTPHFP